MKEFSNRAVSPSLDVFHGGGVCGELLQAIDWSQSPLGPVDQWHQSLKTAIRIMLTSRQAMWVGWGDQLIYFYNDAYLSIIGGRHPQALGQPVLDVWPELREIITPMLYRAMHSGEGVYVEDQLFIMERNGYAEETYYTFSYSPIPDDQGLAGGILCANTDETQRVIGERQQATFQQTAASLSQAQNWSEACQFSLYGLSCNPQDILFAVLYMPDQGKGELVRCSLKGLDSTHPLANLHRSPAMDDHIDLWEVIESGEARYVELSASASVEDLSNNHWQVAPKLVSLQPIRAGKASQYSGVLVFGLNPYRLLDDGYKKFIELLASQISSALANILAIEGERQRADALADLDQAKTRFFSNVSHEFRTPLTLILGPLEQLLEAGDLAEGQRQELELVYRNGLRLLKHVNSLLEFSRVEAGRVKAEFLPTRLHHLTEHLASQFSLAMTQSGLDFKVDCDSLSEPIFIDLGMWEQILFNLLSNAYKYTLEGFIRLELREREHDVELRVEDSGIGIAADEQANIFKHFHRVDNAEGRSQEGSGIGLALARELVRLHCGSISVSSEVGKGSVFTVCIPKGYKHLPGEQVGRSENTAFTSKQAEAYIQEALCWHPSSSAPANPPPLAEDLPWVLLAEDNADMRNHIMHILQHKYRVTAVGDGRLALERLRSQRPDLLISDVMMPNLGGFELLRAIRQDLSLRDLPVILLSARAGEEAEIEGLQGGADDYLVKPFSGRELLARVDSLLTMRQVRQDQEVSFRIVADGVPAMLWMTSTDGSCTYLSAQWYNITGGHSPQDLGDSWMLKIHPDDLETVKMRFAVANRDREAIRFKYRLRDRHGGYRWVIDSCLPRLDGNGRFMGFVGCVFDVNDQVLAEERLKANEEVLKESDKRKDEFLATLAHELRNPLAPIASAVDILRSSPDPSHAELAIDIVGRQIQQLVRLVDDLMDVSRITRGKVALRKTKLDLRSAIQNAIDSTLPIINRNQQEFSASVPNEPISLFGDLTRLSQIFANILNNASKYTPTGGCIELDVSTTHEQVRVAISDNGDGIPQEKLAVIFDMFLQLDSSIGRQQDGLGIGLTLVRQLVQLHGGRIEVSSEGTGKGALFEVYLPVSLDDKQSDDGPEKNQAEPTMLDAGLRVLVVDDNKEAAQALTLLLSLKGLQATHEFSGKDALDRLSSFRPHVVLLDIGMPEMDGLEVCRQIKSNPEFEHIICIAQTGWGEKQHLQQSTEVGFSGHLVKPIDFQKLESLLQILNLDELSKETDVS